MWLIWYLILMIRSENRYVRASSLDRDQEQSDQGLHTAIPPVLLYMVKPLCYAPTSEAVDGAYWFRVVHASVRSRTVHARVLKFHIWIPHGKIFDALFFLAGVISLSELCPFGKLKTKSDACHILWTVHARVLKFHMWIPHGKIADPYFFSYPSYLPFWSYAPFKKSAWNLVIKISRNVFELGAWNLVSL